MSDSPNKTTGLLLDEPLSTPAIMWWLTGIIVCSGVISGLAGKHDVTPLLIGVTLATTAFMVGVAWLTYWLYCCRMRLKMDATRVWSHIPLTKDRSLSWADVRTAAIVTLKNVNYPAMIVLSVHAPQETLTRKRMLWKNPRRGEELRIQLTDTRRTIVEQQLNMRLPEIQL